MDYVFTARFGAWRKALVISMLMTSASVPAMAQAVEKKPNFLVIVADDLGYSDLGAFGGEIETPNLDAIAKAGLRMTDFHVAPTCSPSRAMLLTGVDNHRAGLGAMAERTAPNQQGKSGYEGYLRPDAVTLAERFAAGGYRTMMSGKWHLGTAVEQDPHARGFQQSFSMLQGAHNHYGSDISSGERGDQKSQGVTYTQSGVVVNQLPAHFYSSDYFTTKLLEFLGSREQDAASGKPFFAYLAFTAPHWPLQAPKNLIEKYKGRYDAGFDKLREHRLRRQAELGLRETNDSAHDMVFTQPWDKMSTDQRAFAARSMEIYAAMVDSLDQNVGRVIEQLKRTGEYDNTVILFLSDNGPEGRDTKTTHEMPADANNNLNNLGAATSYAGYGPGWAQAGSAPAWLVKYYATEGGTRTTAFLRYPGLTKAGSISKTYQSVVDITPTFLELAGLPNATDTFQGRHVEPVIGKSWLPFLRGKAPYVYGPDNAVGTELFGSRSIRQGDWKITDTGNGVWRLFNLKTDPGETNDLSHEQPERIATLQCAWTIYAQDTGLILPPKVVLPQP
jgi:arylsulfatase